MYFSRSTISSDNLNLTRLEQLWHSWKHVSSDPRAIAACRLPPHLCHTRFCHARFCYTRHTLSQTTLSHTHTQRRLLLRGKCGISIRLGFVEVTPAAVPCQMRHVKKLIGLTPAAFPWQAQHFERFVGWGGPPAFQEVIVGPGGAPWLALVWSGAGCFSVDDAASACYGGLLDWRAIGFRCRGAPLIWSYLQEIILEGRTLGHQYCHTELIHTELGYAVIHITGVRWSLYAGTQYILFLTPSFLSIHLPPSRLSYRLYLSHHVIQYWLEKLTCKAMQPLIVNWARRYHETDMS